MNKKNQVKRIFDSIASRYDLLNHLLSMGTDIYWRNKAITLTKMKADSVLLDVACGTGDFSITARKKGIINIFGADLSKVMLELYEDKAEWIKGRTLQMTAENCSFKKESFTNIIVAFGVRNFYDIQQAFNSFHSILKPNGKVTVLEFRLPKNKLVNSVYRFYFERILPLIGKIISKDKEAYYYLPNSVEEFDSKVELTEIFENSGFRKIESHSLTFGIVQVVLATK